MTLMSTVAIIPHYFEKKANMAYMATGLGAGIGLSSFPYIYTSFRSSLSYRDTMLCMLPIAACSASAPLAFKAQLPNQQVKSFTRFIKGYIRPLKQSISIFYMMNTYFWNVGQVGVAILLFSYINDLHGIQTATNVQTIFGLLQAIGGITFTLLLIKVKVNHFLLHIFCNATNGIACIAAAIFTQDYVQYICAAVIGFVAAVTIGNMGCVCSHLYAKSDVEYMFGYQEAVGGIAGIIGPFTTSLLQSKLGLSSGFYFMGAHLLVGAAVLVLLMLFKRSVISPFAEDSESNTDDETSEQTKTETTPT